LHGLQKTKLRLGEEQNQPAGQAGFKEILQKVPKDN